jgi:hypothetical protein
MALDESAFKHYSAQLQNLGIPATKQAISYLLMLQKYLRCPVCYQQAQVRYGHLYCDYCNRGWLLQDLILKPPTQGGVPSSAPASGEGCPLNSGDTNNTREVTLFGTPPVVNDPHSQRAGGVINQRGENK